VIDVMSVSFMPSPASRRRRPSDTVFVGSRPSRMWRTPSARSLGSQPSMSP
jgi:hypothetical protein